MPFGGQYLQDQLRREVMESTSASTRKGRQTMQSYQTLWMAHWTGTSSNSAAVHDDSALGIKELDSVSKDEDLTNGLEAMNSKSSRNEAICSTLMKHGQDTDETQAITQISSHNLKHGKAMDGKVGIQATPSQERFQESSTRIVSYHDLEKSAIDKGKAVVCPSKPSIVSNNQFPNTKFRIVEQEHSQPADLLCQRKFGSHSESDISINARYRKSNTSLLLDALSMSECHLPTVGREWFHSGIVLLRGQSITSEKNELKMSNYDHTPLITEKPGVTISKGNDTFRRSNLSSDFHNLPPFFGQANRGLKLELLSSSPNSEGQGIDKDIGIGTPKLFKKNETLAETDTMEMDFLKERPNSGANPHWHCSAKGFHLDANLSPWFDINLELPALPALTRSLDNMGPTSSRTQRLEMEKFPSHAEQPTPISNLGLNDTSKEDPTTRWVKRLKPSSSDSSGRGTKSSNLSEKSPHDKKRVLFRSILKNSITSSELTARKHHGKGTMLLSDRRRELPAEKGKDLLLSLGWIKRWLRKGSQISQRKPENN